MKKILISILFILFGFGSVNAFTINSGGDDGQDVVVDGEAQDVQGQGNNYGQCTEEVQENCAYGNLICE
ncbi:hypothetical protein LR002_03240, partial [Candidatus Gracilibacteria bacterium]|nr:hypothetical protein [Candidatus Gracilibacteria bacterium]